MNPATPRTGTYPGSVSSLSVSAAAPDAPHFRALAAMDVAHGDRPQRLPRGNDEHKPLPEEDHLWWWQPQDDCLVVEGATVSHRLFAEATRLPLPQAQQIWHSHLGPRTHITVRAKEQIEGAAYVAFVQDDHTHRGLPPAHRIVAKIHTLRMYDAPALRTVLNSKVPCNYYCRHRQLVPHALRDGLFSRLIETPSFPRRLLLSHTSLMTLHPMADGDLQHLLVPLSNTSNIMGEAIVRHIARATLVQLARCESMGVLHGDIKPQNILFWADGLIGLSDFSSGMYQWEERALREDGVVLTSPAYQAFDEWTMAGTTELSDSFTDSTVILDWPFGKDIFSLGVSLLFLASGLHPFNFASGQTDLAAIFARNHVWRSVFADIEKFASGGPPPVITAVQEALHDGLDRLRAQYFVRAFKQLAARAPTLLPIICSMLHPAIDARPHAYQLVDQLEQTRAGVRVDSKEIPLWFHQQAQKAPDVLRLRPEPVQHQLPMRRPRSHTLHTFPQTLPSTPSQLTSAITATRQRATEELMALRSDLIASALDAQVRDLQEPEDLSTSTTSFSMFNSPVSSARVSPILQRSMLSMTSPEDMMTGISE